MQWVGIVAPTVAVFNERKGIPVSADNILIILQARDKVRVYDVNFSWISGFEEWSFPITESAGEFLTKLIVDSPHEIEVHKCETVNQAEGFCIRYQRENLVEYGFSSIVPKEQAEVLQRQRVKNKKLSKLKRKRS